MSGSGLGNHGFTGSWSVVLPVPMREDKSPSLQVTGGSISDVFPVVAGVCEGCVLAPTLFNACMDWILGKMTER